MILSHRGKSPPLWGSLLDRQRGTREHPQAGHTKGPAPGWASAFSLKTGLVLFTDEVKMEKSKTGHYWSPPNMATSGRSHWRLDLELSIPHGKWEKEFPYSKGLLSLRVTFSELFLVSLELASPVVKGHTSATYWDPCFLYAMSTMNLIYLYIQLA